MSPCLTKPELKNLSSPSYGLPKQDQNKLLQTLGTPHVDSFNYMLNDGLKRAVQNLIKLEFALPNNDKIAMQIEDANIFQPSVPPGTAGVKNPKIYPTECRQRASTYKGKLLINVNWWLNGKKMSTFEKDLGDIPIMLKSAACHLYNMPPTDLIKHKEHAEEWGGYFVVKGHERLVRMLLLTRRNYPIAVKRSGWKSRGSLFSDLGLLIRCVTNDQTSTNNTLHFITDGSAKLMFSHNKVMYYVPVTLMLKCLSNHTDQQIYRILVRGQEDDLYYSSCVQNMLRSVHEEGLHTQTQCLEYIGKMFRSRFDELPSWLTNIEVAQYIIQQCVLIHLKKNEEKFYMLIFMTQKLFTLSQNKCKIEGADAVMMQELMLGGHLYLQIIKDRLQNWLSNVRLNLLKRSRTNVSFVVNQNEIQQSAKFAGGLENILESFLSTGNLSTRSGLGLMQNTGLTIVAENINRMRYMSHFRAVHRGAFFTEMRTTEARQLLPDAWGFICPVHTPDGSPCGLLNHLTMDCQVTNIPDPDKLANIELFLVNGGMIPMDSVLNVDYKNSYTVMLDGFLIGHIMDERATLLVNMLRQNKIAGKDIPNTLEIVLVSKKKIAAQYPGLFLFTGPARMMRPVINLTLKQIELIGTWEQVYLDIAVVPNEIYPGITTHLELTKTAFLSNLANLIPMPDCNQSPRNMYQCQMGKQTMGTPLHYWLQQAETKLYRLQTPATPLFRPVHYDNIDLDDHPMGTNAIIAVISYTGYDMEDAMIINKESYERGFAHGSVYKSEFVTLEDSTSYFCRDPNNQSLVEYLDTDGLPHPGSKLRYNVPYYCFYNAEESRYIVKKYQSTEEAFVDNIRLCGTFSTVSPKTACITIRIPRNPSVGDKFASRAGQKGICSQKWPAQDLPWTETGLVPDIVFNPHGFPSRMTIAMMIECMAGKSAALHGLVHDATPFRFDEKDTAIDYFGRLLEAGGYNYYGTERLYSGIDGRELNADIFFGIVHYQRLRHMVSDKWQVRSTGPIDGMTRQPIKGRKRGGGVRFGEMERDSLLSHGASFLLQDRLFHCSDKTTVLICQTCGTLLGPFTEVSLDGSGTRNFQDKCRMCGENGAIHPIQIPYIFKYLVAQFSSVNINVQIKCKET